MLQPGQYLRSNPVEALSGSFAMYFVIEQLLLPTYSAYLHLSE